MYQKFFTVLVIIILGSMLCHSSTANVEKIYGPTPIQQMKKHVPINQISCQYGLYLVMKKSDGSPACVKTSSIAILIERGWAIHLLPEYTKVGPKNSDMFDGGDLQVMVNQVNYFENTTGYIATPVQKGNYPGIILIHEWWGLNDNIKSMAKGFASHGYTAMAVDLYGGQIATTSDGARQLLLSFDEQKGISNIKSAVNLLRHDYNATKIATIGWCFGGSQSLNYALSGNNLDGTIIYYGQPVTNTSRLSSIKWPVLGFFGENDQSISADKVREFKSALDRIGIQNDIHIYPGLGHAFANPSGTNYAPKETQDSWNKTLSFMNRYLK